MKHIKVKTYKLCFSKCISKTDTSLRIFCLTFWSMPCLWNWVWTQKTMVEMHIVFSFTLWILCENNVRFVGSFYWSLPRLWPYDPTYGLAVWCQQTPGGRWCLLSSLNSPGFRVNNRSLLKSLITNLRGQRFAFNFVNMQLCDLIVK